MSIHIAGPPVPLRSGWPEALQGIGEGGFGAAALTAKWADN